MPKTFLKYALGFFIVFLAYAIGFSAGGQSVPSVNKIEGIANKETQIQGIDFNVFWDAWRAVEEKYVGRKDMNRQNMVYGAVEGMVRSVGDPYTAFFTPEQSQLLTEDISGEFSGIGAEIGFRGGVLTVISPMKDSPAERAGLRTGDKILKIDEKFTADLSLEEAVSLIRGGRGTSVTLSIFRDGFDEGKDFTMYRDTIKVPVLEWKREGDIVHIRLHNFIGNIDEEFLAAARAIVAMRNPHLKVILDLRGNAGGFLDSAIEVASFFVPRGEVVVREDFGNGESDEFRSKGYSYFQKTPVVMLIDEGSASASEIVAGALKDARGITLIGQKTFGKGSVQEVTDLPNQTILKVTVAKWLTPKGQSIDEQGIEPDVKVEMTEADKEAGRDPQLEKAREIIRNL